MTEAFFKTALSDDQIRKLGEAVSVHVVLRNGMKRPSVKVVITGRLPRHEPTGETVTAEDWAKLLSHKWRPKFKGYVEECYRRRNLSGPIGAEFGGRSNVQALNASLSKRKSNLRLVPDKKAVAGSGRWNPSLWHITPHKFVRVRVVV